MYYIIEEKKENRITANDKEMYISIDDILLLNNIEETIEHIVKTSKYLKVFYLNDEVLDLIKESIIHDLDENLIIKKLSEMRNPFFSLLIGYINNEKEKYKKLKNIHQGNIVIKCTKENFIKCLKYANSINNKVIILEAKNISLSEYKELLSHCNLNELNNPNITVSYQETTCDLTIKELYDLSLIIDEVANKINKYNLSPLEKIIYVYDFVKQREYHECENKTNSRDLEKVVNGENIVCVGFSNLFNAILNSLNIPSRPLISIKRKHQRSMVYIKDSQYNVDGIYIFDPTWDSRKSNEYINNYNYFAMPFNESERDCPTELYQKTNISLEEIIDTLQIDLSQDKPISFDKINTLEDLFKFTKTASFDEMSNIISLIAYETIEARKKACYIYNTFLKKYNPGNIPVPKLFEAIINTRIIEYYVGEVEDINIENIKLGVSDRYTCRRPRGKDDGINNLLMAIFYGDDPIEELSEYEEKNENKIKRKTLNIRLLKTLRNIQK